VTTPVFFLPGSLCDERVFADQLREIDQPSQVADLTLDDSFAAMATRVLSEAPERFAVVGISMGCIVAAEIAHLAPERLLGMALIDFNLDAPDEIQNRTRRRWASDVRAGHFVRVVEEIGPAMTISPEAHGPLIVDMAMAVGPAGFLKQNDALRDRHDRRPIVSSFQRPLLIACGRRDKLCPPRLHADLAARVPHATLVVAERAGHLSTIDQPARLTSAIESWLQMCNNHKPRRGNCYEFSKA
jgi:pimeloyl-ACP methyl ester carboxylesterase